MTSDSGTVLLERALDQTAAVIAAIPVSQASLPTPCTDWDVQALVRHLIGQDLRNFLTVARGGTTNWQAPADEVGDDWSAAFNDRAQELLAAWQGADIDQLGRANQQVAELATHTWDLVKATGQQADLDPTLAERSLDWSHQMLRPEHRGPGMAFGLEVPVPADAPAYDRLAGWFGRDPGWKPAH